MLKICVIFVGALMAPLLAWMSIPTLMCLAVFCVLALPVAAVIVAYKHLTAPKSDAAGGAMGAGAVRRTFAVVEGGGVPKMAMAAHQSTSRSAA
jgi:hypothetical protein